MTLKFLDTGYLIALENVKDEHHERVMSHWKRYQQNIGSPRPLLITTSYVFDEVVTYLNSRGKHATAVDYGKFLMESRYIQHIPVDEALFDAGWQYFQKHQDKAYSLTDCISFVTMERLGIETALTVDGHFIQAGFQVEPG